MIKTDDRVLGGKFVKRTGATNLGGNEILDNFERGLGKGGFGSRLKENTEGRIRI
jgi:hypothetical protein